MKDDDEEEDGLEQEELVVEDVLEQEEDLGKEELLKEEDLEKEELVVEDVLEEEIKEIFVLILLGITRVKLIFLLK